MQTAIRSLDGMATMFHNTQIINIGATTDNQLMQLLFSIKPNGVYENMPLAFVQSGLSNHRQVNTLKAIMVSPTYWKSLISVASPSTVAQVKVHPQTIEYLLPGNRFIQILPSLAPKQTLYHKTYEIYLVGGVGQVNLGFPFVSTSLSIVGSAPTLTFPSTGLLQFAAGDVGSLIDASFVTAPVYTVVSINYAVMDTLADTYSSYGYVMHPLLATTLGITIPTI